MAASYLRASAEGDFEWHLFCLYVRMGSDRSLGQVSIRGNVPQPVVAHICDVYNWEMRLACAEADGAVGSSVFEFKIGPGAIRAGRDYYAGIRAVSGNAAHAAADVASWRGDLRRHAEALSGASQVILSKLSARLSKYRDVDFESLSVKESIAMLTQVQKISHEALEAQAAAIGADSMLQVLRNSSIDSPVAGVVESESDEDDE